MLKIKTNKVDGTLRAALSGSLDETSETVFDGFVKTLKRDPIAFDLAELKNINSYGFRTWTKVLAEIARREVFFEFINCPVTFVEYCSLLSTLSYAQRITSLLVTLKCDSCKRTQLEPFEVDALRELDAFSVELCPHCNGSLTSAVGPDHYKDMLGHKGDT